ncbi:MAG: hypothetical protein NT092_05660 [Bacteroidia bacterium]|nr:hypothetical protein [Bacteroidia bacterium]
MSKIAKILQYVLIFLLIVLAGGCASSGKGSSRSAWEKKRRTAARTNTATVGRNKFFYSTNYQKKLGRTFKGKR